MATTVNVLSANPFPISLLPKDILIKILSTLPTKTIVQCKQVCKEWRDIILDPDFAEAHYSYTTTTSRLSMVCYWYTYLPPEHDHYPSLYPLDDDSIYLIEEYNHQHDYKLVSSKFIYNKRSLINQNWVYVVNSCRGFLFLTTLDYDHFCVYNPLTKQHFNVPKPMVNDSSEMMITMLVLGFGPVTKQYKVVRMVVDKDKGVYDLRVYTVGTDHVWRSVETNKISSDLRDNKQCCVYGEPLALNGVLHWSMEIKRKIACFDVDKEELSAMASPCSKDSRKNIVSIENVNGLLCLGIQESGKPRDEMVFWVMREYGVKESWAIYVVLKNEFVVGSLSLVKVCDNEEIVFQSSYKHLNLFSYNQKKGSITRLRISGFDKKTDAQVETYVPSFFFIS